MYIYLGYDSNPDDFGQLWRFCLNANGRTDGHTADGQTYGHTDIRTYGRTDPHIEMRGRI